MGSRGLHHMDAILGLGEALGIQHDVAIEVGRETERADRYQDRKAHVVPTFNRPSSCHRLPPTCRRGWFCSRRKQCHGR